MAIFNLNAPTNFTDELKKRNIIYTSNNLRFTNTKDTTSETESIWSETHRSVLRIEGDWYTDGTKPYGYNNYYPDLTIGKAATVATPGDAVEGDRFNRNIPPIVKINTWNALKGNGKGFGIWLGSYPVKIEVFQNATNDITNRMRVTTNRIDTTTNPISYPEVKALNVWSNGALTMGDYFGDVATNSNVYEEHVVPNGLYTPYIFVGASLPGSNAVNAFRSRIQLKSDSTLDSVTSWGLVYLENTPGTKWAKFNTSTDLEFSANSGLVFNDRTTGARMRLFMNNGVLGLEAV